MSGESSEDTNVRVAVRCRPFNSKEKANGESSCVNILSDQIILRNPSGNGEEHSFAFDLIIREDSSQESVWNTVGTPILAKAFSGYNGTIFAYGQTGSGKTWSMQGAPESTDLMGIIPRMNLALFAKIDTEKQKRPTIQFLVTVSYFEIYNEVIFDLLDATDRKKKNAGASKGGLEIKEHPVLGVYVKGLQEMVVDSAPKLQAIIDQGMGHRTVASTQMNADSSRSHSVFMITIHQKDLEDESRNIFAKINLVDLAGSERVKSTGATGSVLKEGANINKSLSALGNVINALVEASKGKGTFIPYRNSKLTRVLQESLGGNSITAMLAALSPAACNFEETLSTLKYANRAKDIKVKAVKNEEASQVNKLNDEIRALKEKLSGQSSNVDTTELELKHRQQLQELEAAMRSTWEAKSQISAEHERERQQLAAEQANAARLLETAKERNWTLLEQKGDLDITLSHVRDLVTRATTSTTEGSAIDSATQQLNTQISNWSALLKEITQLERTLSEQDTIVQVYRSSLEKDSHALIKTTSKTNDNAFDNTSLSQLRQLKDKFIATQTEVSKWTSIQDTLMLKIAELVKVINDYHSNGALLQSQSNGVDEQQASSLQYNASKQSLASVQSSAQLLQNTQQNKSEDRELIRGVELLQKQSMTKQITNRESIASTRNGLMNFNSVVSDLTTLLKTHETIVSSLILTTINEETDHTQSTQHEQLVALQQGIVSRLIDLESVHRTTSEIVNTSESRNITPPPDSMQSSSRETNKSQEEQLPEMVTIDYLVDNLQSISNINSKSAKKTAAIISTEGDRYWSCPTTAVSNKQSAGEFTITLDKPQYISSLVIQGAMSQYTVVTKCASSVAPSPVPLVIAIPTLPCGVTLETCDGNTDVTAAALGDVLDWSILLKKNPPEKFLKRPPVRFLFDLIKHIAENNTGYFSPTLERADWEEVGLSKQSKLDFMQEVIDFVTQDLIIAEPVTTATNIVTGSDPELTNTLLQQLAVSLYRFGNKAESSAQLQEQTAAPATKSAISETTTTAIESTWITSCRVMLSLDGSTWIHNQVYNTDLMDEKKRVQVPLLSQDIPNNAVYAKYMRVIPVTWSGEHGPALRLDIMTIDKQRLTSAAAKEEYQRKREQQEQQLIRQQALLSSITVVSADIVLSVLTALTSTLDSLISTVEFMAVREESNRLKKQEDVKKHLENLAKEKLALERLLENEKQTLANDKADLSEQLKTCFNQLRETQGLLEKEQEINAQVSKDYKQLEDKNNVITADLRICENENSSLKAEILKLQANSIKNQQLIDTLQSTIDEHDKTIETLRSDAEYNAQLKSNFDTEKDEFLSNISVLTEELEVARSHEETLFEQLNERTQDLERLQESYVDISDQYNNSQDELMELRDQLERLQDALANKTMFSKSFNTTPAAAQSSSNGNGGGNNKTTSTVNTAAVPKVVELNYTSNGNTINGVHSNNTSPRGHKSSGSNSTAAGSKSTTSSTNKDSKLSRNAVTNGSHSVDSQSPRVAESKSKAGVTTPLFQSLDSLPLGVHKSTNGSHSGQNAYSYAPSPPPGDGISLSYDNKTSMQQGNRQTTSSTVANEDAYDDEIYNDYEDEFED